MNKDTDFTTEVFLDLLAEAILSHIRKERSQK